MKRLVQNWVRSSGWSMLRGGAAVAGHTSGGKSLAGGAFDVSVRRAG